MNDEWRQLKREFVDTGYLTLNGWLGDELVEQVQADSLTNRGISIFECPSVGNLLCDPKIVAFLGYLFSVESSEVAISPFRFWNHLTQGGFSDGGGWHVDDTYMADRPLTEVLCMYYPQVVTEDMGPTMVLPGSHRRLYTPPQTSKLGWIKGQHKVVVEAGTVVIAYASILHARAAHFSDKPRSMIKYGYEVGNPQYGYYMTQEAFDNFRRADNGGNLTKYVEVRAKKDAVWNSYWKNHESYTFQDFKHQIGIVGRALRKRLDHEAIPDA